MELLRQVANYGIGIIKSSILILGLCSFALGEVDLVVRQKLTSIDSRLSTSTINISGSTSTITNTHFDVGGSTVNVILSESQIILPVDTTGSTVTITNTRFDVGGSTLIITGSSVTLTNTNINTTLTATSTNVYTVNEHERSKNYNEIIGKCTGDAGVYQITYYGYGTDYGLLCYGSESQYWTSLSNGTTGYLIDGQAAGKPFAQPVSSPTIVNITLPANTTVHYNIGGLIWK